MRGWGADLADVMAGAGVTGCRRGWMRDRLNHRRHLVEAASCDEQPPAASKGEDHRLVLALGAAPLGVGVGELVGEGAGLAVPVTTLTVYGTV